MTNNDKDDEKKNKDENQYNSNKKKSEKITKSTKNTPKNIKKLNQHRIKEIIKNLNKKDDYLGGREVSIKKISLFISYCHHNVKLKIKSFFDDFVFE